MKPDFVGLSGLLVKSAQQMVFTAQDMKEAGLSLPILVGGAALSRKFTDTKISKEYDGLVLYAKDAMTGLSLANQVQSSEGKEQLLAEKRMKEEAALASAGDSRNRDSVVSAIQKPHSAFSVSTEVPVIIPKDTVRHVLKSYSLSHLEPYINMQMLLGRHSGVQGKVSRLLEEGDEKCD